jgi:hypothetical protein
MVRMAEATDRTGYLKVKVPDLPSLKNNRGIYPTAKVMSAIGGRRVVGSHGDRETLEAK